MKLEQPVVSFLFQLLFALISAVCGWLIGKLKTKQKKKKDEETEEQKRQDALQEFMEQTKSALVFSLRCDLITLHNKIEKKGYCDYALKIEFEDGYKIYHALGGNGSVTQMKEEIDAMPAHPVRKSKKEN